MAVSSTTGGLRTGVCLSTDRPQNPYNGQVIYETDTNRTLVWDNSAWVVVADPALVSFSGTGATVTADAMTVAGENVTPYTGRRNLVYNGAMQVAQRGTSSTGTTSAYRSLDRWKYQNNSAGSFTVTQDTDAPDGFSNSYKATCGTADATPVYLQVWQGLEGQDLQHLMKGTSSAKSLTVSFWVKSNVAGTFIVELEDADNSRGISKSYSVSSADTWEYKTLTFEGDTMGAFDNDNGLSLRLNYWLSASSTYTSGTLQTTWGDTATSANRAVGLTGISDTVNNYWQITGVQLEVGNKATPFEHRSYGEELALCQRYYYKPPQHYYSTIAYGNWIDFSAFLRATMPIGVAMRANPSVTYSSYLIYGNGGSGFTGSGTIYTYGQNSGQLVLGFGHQGTGMGAGNIGNVVAPSGMEVSAEL